MWIFLEYELDSDEAQLEENLYENYDVRDQRPVIPEPQTEEEELQDVDFSEDTSTPGKTQEEKVWPKHIASHEFWCLYLVTFMWSVPYENPTFILKQNCFHHSIEKC